MRKAIFLFSILISQFIFGQEDYSKYKPVEPLYNNGGVEKFYEYLSNAIDYTKVENEKESRQSESYIKNNKKILYESEESFDY